MILLDLINDDKYIWKVLVAAKSETKCELFEFVKAMSKTDLKKWYCLVAQLKAMATEIRGPAVLKNCHELGSKKYKIFRFESGRIRIAWFYGKDDKVIICSHGYYKKEQKTKKINIETAEKVYETYICNYRKGKKCQK